MIVMLDTSEDFDTCLFDTITIGQQSTGLALHFCNKQAQVAERLEFPRKKLPMQGIFYDKVGHRQGPSSGRFCENAKTCA